MRLRIKGTTLCTVLVDINNARYIALPEGPELIPVKVKKGDGFGTYRHLYEISEHNSITIYDDEKWKYASTKQDQKVSS